MITYEQKLNRDVAWAFREGSMHFDKGSSVHDALRKITSKLSELGIPYALVGGMAMFFHGYRRFTEDVDILVTQPGLQEIHRRLEGLGYLPPFAGSKQLRDTENGVRIEFLVAGHYPGDGQPKPVAFPSPEQAHCMIDGIAVITLPRLIELKLASGMTAPGRLRDLGDVEAMIQQLHLPREYANQLDPYVRDKYDEIWNTVQQTPPEP
jgi:hypothetical protein